jgi:hypothetical protein
MFSRFACFGRGRKIPGWTQHSPKQGGNVCRKNACRDIVDDTTFLFCTQKYYFEPRAAPNQELWPSIEPPLSDMQLSDLYAALGEVTVSGAAKTRRY